MLNRIKCCDVQHEKSNASKIQSINNEETCGQRRKLVKSLLNFEAMNSVKQELTPKIDSYIYSSSEYNDNFCNSTTAPSVMNDEIRMKHPLYGGCVQTIYSQLLVEGMLKNRDAIADLNAPFKRINVISSSLEIVSK